MFGLLFPALCDFAQERQNFVGCDAGKIPILAKVSREFGERLAVGVNRIFFPNSFCGTLGRLEPLVRVSWRVSFPGCGWAQNGRLLRTECKISFWKVQESRWALEFEVLARYPPSINNDPAPP